MLKKIPHRSCAPILARAALSPEAGLDPEAAPAEAIKALTRAGALLDLARFVAHALPSREGVCWAAACLEAAPTPLSAAERAGVAAARAWVRRPTEALRRACEAEAAALGVDRAAGWLCLAAFWNGSGSITPADQPMVAPAADLHAKALFGAVGLAAPIETSARAAYLERVAARAWAVADGAWPGLEPAAARPETAPAAGSGSIAEAAS